MPWFRADDAFPQHPKVLAIPRRDRTAAIGLWSLAGMWCAGQLTDGFVPDYMVEELAGTKKLAGLLVTVGLWAAVDGGYVMHDYLDYNPSADDVRADQRRKHEAKAKAGRAGGIASGVARRKHERSEGEAEPKQNEAPSRPVPSSSNEEEDLFSAAPIQELREDVEAICQHLMERLVGNGRKGVSVTAAWRKSARLMLDRDERPIEEVQALIDWCQSDAFWRPNIGGMPKFREQYDKLRLQAQARGQLAPAGEIGREEINNILGPDHWTLPRPPLGLSEVEELAWEQRTRREHLADRQAQARARMGRTA